MQKKKLLRDHPNGGYSVHAQVQAVLANYLKGDAAGALLLRALNSEECRQIKTLYYRAHLAEALRKSGQASFVYQHLLGDWFKYLEADVSTWSESDIKKSRSDCHAWGCVPEIEIVQSVFGLSPAEPGWARIRFSPLDELIGELSFDTPHGKVHLQRSSTDADWEINSPVPIVSDAR